jgi:1-acyl-sn-glycerol-3-phosphate acyltransferase
MDRSDGYERKELKKIRALYVLIEFVITVTIVIGLMYIFKKQNKTIRTKWAKLQKKLIGFEVKQEGCIDNSADIYLMNHQSLLDIVAIESITDNNLAWVAKKEIGDLFVFGHILKAPNMIAVDRESKKSLIKLISDAKDRKSHGRKIAMFPEGTRSKGDRILKFRSGAKILSEKLNLKVQPIVIQNTNKILDSKTFEVSKGVVDVTFLPSITPEKNSEWFEDMRDNMIKVFNK